MFAAIQSRRLYRQVADQIRSQIEHGQLGVGERLPGERELAEELGVSRPTIREALDCPRGRGAHPYSHGIRCLRGAVAAGETPADVSLTSLKGRSSYCGHAR